MSYLIAKYALIFLLSAVMAFLLGRWSVSRRFVDVTESYETLRAASRRSDTSQWEKLWRYFDRAQAPSSESLSGVTDRLDALAYELTKASSRRSVDLSAFERRLKELADSAQNLGPIRDELSGLRREFEELRHDRDEELTDLRPLQRQLAALEQHLVNTTESANTSPVERRLLGVEHKLEALRSTLDNSKPVATREPLKAGAGRQSFLPRAIYGNKDDLRRISGVGPKLERLLNKNGVFYFWQIASWSQQDIEAIDCKLETFKGRIVRDDWITQASKLCRLPWAAPRPVDVRDAADVDC